MFEPMSKLSGLLTTAGATGVLAAAAAPGNFTDTALSLGVGGVLAYVIFLAYRKDSLQRAETWKQQNELLIGVIGNNTVATTKLTVLLEGFIAAADRRQPPPDRRGEHT